MASFFASFWKVFLTNTSYGCPASKLSQSTLILGKLEGPLSLPSLFGAGFQSASLFSLAADGGFGNLQKNQSKMHLVVITY